MSDTAKVLDFALCIGCGLRIATGKPHQRVTSTDGCSRLAEGLWHTGCLGPTKDLHPALRADLQGGSGV